MVTTKSTHGGKRPGAGRPKEVEAPIRRTVYLEQDHVEFIEAVRIKAGCETFSQALRGIIECDYEFEAWSATLKHGRSNR